MRVAYLCSWRSYSEQELQLVAKEVDTILVAFVGINPDGTIRMDDLVDNFLGRLRLLPCRVGVSVGGWTHRYEFHRIVDADKFAASINANIDLVDVDWEFDSVEQARKSVGQYHQLVKSLKKLFKVSCAIQLSMVNLLVPDHVEFVTLMAYDQSGPWSMEADHYAAYSKVRRLHLHSDKFLLGVSMARAVFHSCSGPGQKFEQCEICPWKEEDDQTGLHWDPVAGSSYTCRDDCLIYQESVESVLDKEQMAKSDGLGGICLWDYRPGFLLPDVV